MTENRPTGWSAQEAVNEKPLEAVEQQQHWKQGPGTGTVAAGMERNGYVRSFERKGTGPGN